LSRLVFAGTSLRTQGRPVSLRRPRPARGHIPANAGETVFKAIVAVVNAAHPCERRGDLVRWFEWSAWAGTSLRTQGRRDSPRRFCGQQGHIPANAGETADPKGNRVRPRAHPCERRGDPRDEAAAGWCGGTSLRTQGRREAFYQVCRSTGHIPANAGETGRAIRTPRSVRAHPCERRGDQSSGLRRHPKQGTSLRTQGRPYTITP